MQYCLCDSYFNSTKNKYITPTPIINRIGTNRDQMHLKYTIGKLFSPENMQSNIFFKDFIGSPTIFGKNVTEYGI